ncbi:CDP-glycerol--glycerophosphate glycerophosphotransferase [Alkalihalobacillus trypoxylicola]|uniref:CDP-glycerol--glycerophosphate glycerophosphotransferase n=1 Tax=Alkalihalobacillus trypoxylicola TaxID=519424 RepID=A0A162DUS4_9BACI|nr:CDP-glycerol--glycerophosphate glycerophosphotransferase [Alkalihalobacillus trypoxylicola]
MLRLLVNRRKIYLKLYHKIFIRSKLNKNRVLFESFSGKSYSDNPRAIYNEMVKQNLPFEYIWIINDTDKEIPAPAKKVKRFSLAYYYYLATSKFWVLNTRLPNGIKKREEVIYIQTWHGTPLKKLAFDMNEVRMPGTTTEKYKRNFYTESQKWDYLVSPNRYSTEIFQRAFKFDKDILEVGYPRNDVLYQKNNQQDILKIKEKIGLPLDKKVILYAPTWRDDEYYGKGKYKFDLKLDLQQFQTRLSGEYVLLLRMHYLIADSINVEGVEDFVYNLSSYNDISELYLVSDVLITDYSSVFFDYGNLKRPIIFFTYDIEKYRDMLRGFYYDFEQKAPGPLLSESEQVINAIEDISCIKNKYSEKFSKFYNRYCSLDNGTSSQQIINQIFKSK